MVGVHSAAQLLSVGESTPSTTVNDMHWASHSQTFVAKSLFAVHQEWQLTLLVQVLVQPQVSLRRVEDVVVLTVVVMVVVVVAVVDVVVAVAVVTVVVVHAH